MTKIIGYKFGSIHVEVLRATFIAIALISSTCSCNRVPTDDEVPQIIRVGDTASLTRWVKANWKRSRGKPFLVTDVLRAIRESKNPKYYKELEDAFFDEPLTLAAGALIENWRNSRTHFLQTDKILDKLISESDEMRKGAFLKAFLLAPEEVRSKAVGVALGKGSGSYGELTRTYNHLSEIDKNLVSRFPTIGRFISASSEVKGSLSLDKWSVWQTALLKGSGEGVTKTIVESTKKSFEDGCRTQCEEMLDLYWHFTKKDEVSIGSTVLNEVLESSKNPASILDNIFTSSWPISRPRQFLAVIGGLPNEKIREGAPTIAKHRNVLLKATVSSYDQTSNTAVALGALIKDVQSVDTNIASKYKNEVLFFDAARKVNMIENLDNWPEWREVLKNQDDKAFQVYAEKKMNDALEGGCLYNCTERLKFLSYLLPDPNYRNMLIARGILRAAQERRYKDAEVALEALDVPSNMKNGLDFTSLSKLRETWLGTARKIIAIDDEISEADRLIRYTKFYTIRAYMVARMAPGRYEISNIYGGRHSILKTVRTDFSSRGMFSMDVKIAKAEKIVTVDGFEQNWTVYEEISDEEKKAFESLPKLKTERRNFILSLDKAYDNYIKNQHETEDVLERLLTSLPQPKPAMMDQNKTALEEKEEVKTIAEAFFKKAKEVYLANWDNSTVIGNCLGLKNFNPDKEGDDEYLKRPGIKAVHCVNKETGEYISYESVGGVMSYFSWSSKSSQPDQSCKETIKKYGDIEEIDLLEGISQNRTTLPNGASALHTCQRGETAINITTLWFSPDAVSKLKLESPLEIKEDLPDQKYYDAFGGGVAAGIIYVVGLDFRFNDSDEPKKKSLKFTIKHQKEGLEYFLPEEKVRQMLRYEATEIQNAGVKIGRNQRINLLKSIYKLSFSPDYIDYWIKKGIEQNKQISSSAH